MFRRAVSLCAAVGQSASRPHPKSVAALAPDVVPEYCSSNALPVYQMLVESPVHVQWRCQACAHEWRTSVLSRCVLKTGCPSCADAADPKLAAVMPSLLAELHPTKNDPFVGAEELRMSHRPPLWWQCGSCNAEFSARVRERVRKAGAAGPQCCTETQGLNVDALLVEWHPTRNGDLPAAEIVNGRVARPLPVWWMCSQCAHEWQAPPQHRLKGFGACPECDPDKAGPPRQGRKATQKP